MITYSIMLFILLFLFFALSWRAEFHGENGDFFNVINTNALRGFWCIVILLVHIPVKYQNAIQDIVGSFAYIGVTFFFMTSAFGLQVAVDKNLEYMQQFWKKRLPKLLIPNLVLNCCWWMLQIFLLDDVGSLAILFNINSWVQWLLFCYLIFWICNKLIKKDSFRNIVICASIIALSLSIHMLKKSGHVEINTWTTEVIGFIYGILLAKFYEKFKTNSINKWWIKIIAICMASLVFGLLYLKYKYIFVLGDYVLKILLGMAITLFMLFLNIRISIGNKVNNF